MSKDDMINLIETLSSEGYEIVKFDKINIPSVYYEILLSPPSSLKQPLSKENILKLFDILFSVGFDILKYELLPDDNCDIFFRNIKLHIT